MSAPENAAVMALLQRALAPDLLAALDLYIREVAGEIADERLARDELAAGREWLTTREAGVLLSCSPEAVRKRCKRGRLAHRYQGARLYVSASSVLDLRGRVADSRNGSSM